MRLDRVFPAGNPIELAGFEALREHFARRYWAAPSLLLNIVSNAEGSFVGENGSSRDISNEADYQALIGYRQAADVVLTTAGTARQEGYRRSRYAPLALVSRSGDFSGIPAVEQANAGPQDSEVILLVRRGKVGATRRRFNQPWVRVASVGSGSPFATTFRLTRLGWRRILVEAGPRYANWLLANSMVRGIALSVVGAAEDDVMSACRPALSALGVNDAELETAERVGDTLFTRWINIRAVKR